MAKKKSEENMSKWRKIGIISGSVVLVLVVLYLLKLNFGDYLGRVFDATKSVFIPAALALFIAYLIRPLNN